MNLEWMRQQEATLGRLEATIMDRLVHGLAQTRWSSVSRLPYPCIYTELRWLYHPPAKQTVLEQGGYFCSLST